jgi:antitoxin VapB
VIVMRNLNIKSDEAYEIATDLARRTGQNLTLVVTAALRASERALTLDERRARIAALATKSGKQWKEGLKLAEHGNILYDDLGLPK